MEGFSWPEAVRRGREADGGGLVCGGAAAAISGARERERARGVAERHRRLERNLMAAFIGEEARGRARSRSSAHAVNGERSGARETGERRGYGLARAAWGLVRAARGGRGRESSSVRGGSGSHDRPVLAEGSRAGGWGRACPVGPACQR